MPGLIEWPARIRPAVTDIPAGTVDIFPTLVELFKLKIEHPVPMDGVSLVPLIDGNMKQRPSPVGFWQFAGDVKKMTSSSGASAWNDNQYKLVKSKPGVWELYAITADRTETKNLAAEHPEVFARMKAELEQWQRSVVGSYNGGDYDGNSSDKTDAPEQK